MNGFEGRVINEIGNMTTLHSGQGTLKEKVLE
jgi:hypothetical protein